MSNLQDSLEKFLKDFKDQGLIQNYKVNTKTVDITPNTVETFLDFSFDNLKVTDDPKANFDKFSKQAQNLENKIKEKTKEFNAKKAKKTADDARKYNEEHTAENILEEIRQASLRGEYKIITKAKSREYDGIVNFLQHEDRGFKVSFAKYLGGIGSENEIQFQVTWS